MRNDWSSFHPEYNEQGAKTIINVKFARKKIRLLFYIRV